MLAERASAGSRKPMKAANAAAVRIAGLEEIRVSVLQWRTREKPGVDQDCLVFGH